MTDAPKPKARKVRDSATLILHRPGRTHPEVLMGRRAETSGPWAGMYVFPGGRVEPGDGRVRAARELAPEVGARLDVNGRRRGRALALAAIRETFEETGLRLALPDPTPGQPVAPHWADFFADGLAPDLGGIDYVVRAVTPVARPVRFNSRFLIADGTHAIGELGGSGELADINWVPLPEIAGLKLPNITRLVFDIIAQAIRTPRAPGGPAQVWTMRGERRLVREE